MTTTFYLIRHGTTAWNQQLRYQGRADNPLDEVGERQGALLKDYFKNIKIDLGITSPLQRAKKTLEYALSSQLQNVPVLVEPDVIEYDFGEADGLTKEEIEERYPDFCSKYVLCENRGQAQAPGGESMRQLYDRVREAILRIAEEHPGETIVVGTHGTAIQAFLNYAMGIPAEDMKRINLCNVSVSCVEISGDGEAHVLFIGDTHHIPEDLQFSYGTPDKKTSG